MAKLMIEPIAEGVSETEALHVEIATLAAHVEAMCMDAPEPVILASDSEAVAEVIIDGEEPDEHGRVMCADAYRPAIIAIADLVFLQLHAARAEVASL